MKKQRRHSRLLKPTRKRISKQKMRRKIDRIFRTENRKILNEVLFEILKH